MLSHKHRMFFKYKNVYGIAKLNFGPDGNLSGFDLGTGSYVGYHRFYRDLIKIDTKVMIPADIPILQGISKTVDWDFMTVGTLEEFETYYAGFFKIEFGDVHAKIYKSEEQF